MGEQQPTGRIPTDRREKAAWYLFDFANTSFTVLIVTALFPLFFRRLVGDPILGGTLWGYAGSITMLVIAVTSPILGAMADYSGAKKKFLTFYTGLSIVFTSLMFFLREDVPSFLGVDMWMWGFILFVIANIGFEGALPFYNAWLPEISTEEDVGRISGIGYAAGYVGAMLTIIIALVSYFMLPDYPTLPFLFAAIFFLVFAVPSIIGLKERPPSQFPDEEGVSIVTIGFRRVRKTFNKIGEYEGLPRFLASYFLFSDAISTVIYFAAIFGAAVYGFSDELILIFFAVTQLAAIPGAFVFGYIADSIGTKKTLMITLGIWIAALLIAFFGEAQIVWWTVGMIAGIGMGSSQSTARSMYGQFIPEEKKTEMFGIYALSGKFAAIIGPAVYGTVLALAASLGEAMAHRVSMLSILGVFVIALLILIKVRQPIMGEAHIYLEDDMRPGM
ncbi:MAG: MFS transporter [Candidatus Thorarchaeota archaeon]